MEDAAAAGTSPSGDTAARGFAGLPAPGGTAPAGTSGTRGETCVVHLAAEDVADQRLCRPLARLQDDVRLVDDAGTVAEIVASASGRIPAFETSDRVPSLRVVFNGGAPFKGGLAVRL